MKAVLWIVQQIGAVGVVFGLTLAYYEGVPGLRDIPGSTHLPIIREFIVGRVRMERAKAAEAATEGMVSRFEKQRLQARAEELQRQIDIISRRAEEARAQALSAENETEQSRKRLERKVEGDNDPNISRWRQLDLDRMREFRANPR